MIVITSSSDTRNTQQVTSEVTSDTRPGLIGIADDCFVDWREGWSWIWLRCRFRRGDTGSVFEPNVLFIGIE